MTKEELMQVYYLNKEIAEWKDEITQMTKKGTKDE